MIPDTWYMNVLLTSGNYNTEPFNFSNMDESFNLWIEWHLHFLYYWDENKRKVMKKSLNSTEKITYKLLRLYCISSMNKAKSSFNQWTIVIMDH
jgi:hypothetical protein